MNTTNITEWPFGQSGIYKIENTVNGKVYIGQSKDIGCRWRLHVGALRRGEGSTKMQNAWNKYGENAFEFEVVELCCSDKNVLNEREIAWIALCDSFHHGYNMTLGGDFSADCTPEAARKIADAARKDVVILNTGEVIHGIDIAAQMYGEYGCSEGTIIRCCKQRQAYSGTLPDGTRLVWCYKTEYDEMTEAEIAERLKRPAVQTNQRSHAVAARQRKHVVLVNTGETFESLKEAAATYHLLPNRVSACCSSRSVVYSKVRNMWCAWRYEDDYNALTSEEIGAIICKTHDDPSRKRVICLSTQTVFDSLTSAANRTGASLSKISACCRGKRHYAGKDPVTGERLRWQYYEDWQTTQEQLASA